MPFRRSQRKTSLQPDGPPQPHHGSHDRQAPATRVKDDAHESSGAGPPLKPPTNWPPNVKYRSQPCESRYLTENQRRWLCRKPQVTTGTDNTALPIIKLPQSRIEIDSRINIKVINDEQHPAHGQRGLFAARDLAPGELVVPYIGYVHSSTASERAVLEQLNNVNAERLLDDSEDVSGPHGSYIEKNNHEQDPPLAIGTWDTSSYDLNLHRDLEEDIELAVDAERMGNEARFCNDYRGVLASNVPDQASKQWDRRAKRGAKTWATKGAVDGESTTEGSGMPMAIPNAEFRDVWFEWTAEDEVDRPRDAATTLDEDSVKTLSIGEKHSGTKYPHRERRRKKAGMRGVAIFVMPAGKSGKRKHGIQAGQEVLVSYGKGFWAHHGLELAKGS
ncbi:hypothetical protein OHC33_009079 [Knufia fluminis]|uniref:SET domain-containing protein n=1 Tax=Knufia fluminis TaxID=191047 RepID=A0AAN8I355_9EURO|nr:hypothetical protein OHC33_009079 [Knufia fluminis]